MHYFSGYYWQKDGQNRSALVLHQVSYKKKSMPVFLGGVCPFSESDGGFMMQQFSDWFYKTGLEKCAGGTEREWQAAKRSLERLLETTKEEMTGILCAGQRIFLFGSEEQKICLLNMRDGKPNCHLLSERGEALMQKTVGVLVSTESFFEKTHAAWTDCLTPQKLDSMERIDRCLRELGSFGERKGGMNMGALLLSVR